MKDLSFAIKLDLSGFHAGMKQSVDTMQNVGNAGKAAFDNISASATTSLVNISKTRRGVASISQQLQNMQRMAAGAFSLIGISDGIGTLTQLSDEYSNVTARLRLATRSADEYNTAYQALVAITRNSMGDFSATADLYASMARATQGLGLSQGSLLRVTDAVNKAIRVSGASTVSASAALVQLQQAMASGVLRGEELNSVIEQTPRIARMIADGAGIAYGDLRAVAQEGKLTSDVVIAAILNEANTVDAEFSRIPPTISGAIQQVHNSFLQLWGDFANTSNMSGSLASSIMSVADNLKAIVMAGMIAVKVAAVGYVTHYVASQYQAITAARAAQAAEIAAAETAVAAGKAKVAQARAYAGASQMAAAATMELAAAEKTLAAATASRNAGMLQSMGLAKKSTAESLAGLGRLSVAGNLAFAAWAGWEIGTYLSDQFAVVRQAGIAMAGGLSDAAVNISAGFKLAWAASSIALEEMIASVKRSFGDLIVWMGEKLSAVPFMGSKAAMIIDYGKGLQAAQGAIETISAATKRINDERKKNLAANDAFYVDAFFKAGQARPASDGKQSAGVQVAGFSTPVGSVKTPLVTASGGSKSDQAAASRAAQEKLQLAQLAIRQAQQDALTRIRIQTAEIEKKRQLQEISDLDALRAKNALAEKTYAIKLKSAQQEAQLVQGQPVQYQRALAKIADLQRQHAIHTIQAQTALAVKEKKLTDKADQERRKAQKKRLQENEAFWQSMFAPVSNAFESAMNGVIRGTNTLRQAMRNMGQSVVLEFANMGVKMVASWAATEAAKTMATMTGTATRTGIEEAGAAKSLLISAGTAVKQIMMKAWNVMAGVYSALAAIPVVGPVIAPVAAGAAFGVVANYATRIASASGGYDIPAGVNPMTQLHQQEMVLPAHIANPLRDMIAAGGASGGNTTHVTIQAMDARSFSQYLTRNASSLPPALKKLKRNFSV